MGKPITYNGTEYASVEAMPAAVRAAYDADMQEFAATMAEAGLDPETGDPVTPAAGGARADGSLAPAWGGARADGSVPVPQEYDVMTGLGPAVQVYQHKGAPISLHLGTPHAYDLVCYRDGFAYRAGGKDVHSLRWEEVAVIQSNLARNASSQGLGWTSHEYTLAKANGEKLVLDDGLENVGDAAEAIKAAVFARVVPALAERYQAGQVQSYGPVTVQRQQGLQMDGQRFAWEAIQDVRVEAGQFKVTLRDGKKHAARTNTIPNIEALCRLIGVKLGAWELPF